VRIGKEVFIAPLFVGANDPRMCHARREFMDYKDVPYAIEDYVRIAVGVTVLPGVVIKENALVGAHSLVTKDVEPSTMVRGVPAKVYGEVLEGERLPR
jgi:acetyltransferase-like isoleucine patch superfamily enzyme